MFLREQANKMYDVVPYFLAKVLSELPSFVVPPMFFVLITFFSVGYTQSVELYFMFSLNAVLTAIAGISFGYLLSAVIKNQVAAMQLSPVIIMPLVLVGGLYVNNGSMPIWLEVFSYISPLKYAFSNYVQAEFETNEYPVAQQMLSFLSFEFTFWEGIMYQACIILSVMVLAAIFLKILVERFQ